MIPNRQEVLPGTRWPMVELIPVTAQHCEAVWSWLGHSGARRWLDFGGGRQDVSKHQLYLRLVSPHSFARLYRLPGETEPRGVLVFNNADDLMGAADIWVVRDLSNTSRARHAITSACARMLATGFLDLQRHVIGTWVVEGNAASIALHDILHMTNTGRQRSRHVIDGRRSDRLLYDMTRDEFGQRFPDVPSELGRTFRDHGRTTDAFHELPHVEHP